ncbi:hypothetical protein [Empedobacter falsenii]|uniref:hypothetical protein n=1 Tax=Empedobacter falsenii TaxID=343874 RepID=UPI003A8052B3
MDSIERTYREICEADKVLIGASNGLSISEGIHIFADNADFREYFSYYRNQLGIPNIINGCFFPYRTAEERWGFYSSMYHYFTVVRPVSQVMQNLMSLIRKKDYFVVTSNIDAHFIHAGFDRDRLFEIEGNCCDMQCGKGCHETVYPAEELLIKMFAQKENGKVSKDLVPNCPQCGGPMVLHIETDRNFVKDHRWNDSASAYRDFCQVPSDKKIVLLELGVGMRNRLIKQPFMDFTYKHPNATYVTFNKGDIYIPSEIAGQSVAMDGNIAKFLNVLAGKNNDRNKEDGNNAKTNS